MLTILADENIANLGDYLSHHAVRLITLKGRDINQDAINQYRPHALFVRSVTPINPSTISDFGDIRFIGSATIGTDHIDIHHLNQHHIHFANAQGCSKHSVAQYVITAILNLRPAYRHQSITLGIVGLGNIGSTLADYATKLGWQVVGYDPFLPPSSFNHADFDATLSCDVISIHTPLTRTGLHPTHQLFNKNHLDKLNDNALLINSARGEIIHEADLLNAIKQKNLQVVLDVFPNEPSVSQALLDHVQLATPHIAGYTLEGKVRGTDMIYQAFCQTFGLPVQQNLAPLLPPNPYHWSDFVTQTQTDLPAALKHFYDIIKDDGDLRAVNHQDVLPADFDRLRKNYALRREWLSNNT